MPRAKGEETGKLVSTAAEGKAPERPRTTRRAWYPGVPGDRNKRDADFQREKTFEAVYLGRFAV
jgi:hypothetical protein